MKKLILTLCLFSFFLGNSYAQTDLVEPDFVGEVLLITPDKQVQPLEKSPAQSKTKAGASLYLVGIGNVKTRLTIKECCSNVRVNQSDAIQLIVRAVDNNTDPLSIIRIFEFESKKKERRAETSSASTFGGLSNNNLNLLSFTAKKYGQSSYILTINGAKAGEYGVHVSNPNALDEKATILSCFGIDGENAQ